MRRCGTGGTALLVSLLLTVPLAHADRASGTWTGELQLRGNYYWEESTRVVAPSAGFRLESPKGVRLHADYLVDTITSASQAAGAVVDVAFTEVRHDVVVGGGYEFDLGDETQLEFDVSTRVSYEPDYRSYGVSLQGALHLNQRTTVLRFGLNVIRDSIRQVLRGGESLPGSGPANRGEIGQLVGIVPTFSWEQVVSPVVTLSLGYDYGYLDGYTANPYRQVPVVGFFQPETHPSERHRHTLHGRLAVYARSTRTAFHLMYRTYLDSWDIAAISPELRIYQELGEVGQLRTRYRYYRQTGAFFARPADQYTAEDVFFTADPKMHALDSHLLGFQLVLFTRFLDETALRFLREASIDLSFDYIWNSSRYGNAVIGQLGTRIPF